ncbi:MAG TPA: 1-acyl-sn-glycerol-3-phosphate acyltransferase, partial [Candidatus Binatus sp.]|nr:1-acyl-sn-glycerol-3-phosphate acyltransferase [Candidatus Binatus sp.]
LAKVSEPHPLFTQADRRRYQINALRQSLNLLKADRVVVIFPEGYPNVDPHFTPKKSNDEFLPFKAGFSAIAESAERSLGKAIPLIPVGIGYEIGEPWIA